MIKRRFNIFEQLISYTLPSNENETKFDTIRKIHKMKSYHFVQVTDSWFVNIEAASLIEGRHKRKELFLIAVFIGESSS